MKTVNRKLSRLLSVALVFLLALTAAVPVFAAPVEQDNLQVVIHNNDGLPGMSTNQFTVYQLFTGTPNKEKEAQSNDWDAENWNNYTLADIEWGASIKGKLSEDDPEYQEGVAENYDYSTALLDALKGLNSESDAWAFDGGTNVFASVTTAADLAAVLEKHQDNAFMQHFATIVGGLNMKAVKPTVVLTPDSADHANDYLTYTFTEPGYYMFADTHTLSTTDADARSEYIIAVLGDQEINLKASVPTVDKEIVGGEHGDKGDVAGVSDYVQFKLTGTLPQNFGDFDFYKYIFHDTLSKGLTYVNETAHPLTVTVYPSQDDADANRNGVTIPATYTTGTNYTVSEPGTETAPVDCSLEVSFADLKVLQDEVPEPIEVTAESVFVVTYYAQVNEDAVILDEGNPNTVLLEYSNDPNHDGTGKTKEKTVYVYAFGLDLTKVDGSNEPLEGAGFVLKDADDNYAIFEDQWVNDDGTDFATTEDDTHTTKVRRLTGWTSGETSPTTAEVKKLIEDYHTAKENFDKATKEQQASDPAGSAYTALAGAKKDLEDYLLESGADGAIPDVYGLDEGTYALEEFIVPDGYNTPKEDFDIKIEATIDAEGKLQKVVYTHDEETVTYFKTADKYTTGNLGDEDVPETDEIGDRVARFHSGLLKDNIENQKAPFLPFTGGMGTLIFYILGAVLIAGAVTYLVIASKKRKKAQENT